MTESQYFTVCIEALLFFIIAGALAYLWKTGGK